MGVTFPDVEESPGTYNQINKVRNKGRPFRFRSYSGYKYVFTRDRVRLSSLSPDLSPPYLFIHSSVFSPITLYPFLFLFVYLWSLVVFSLSFSVSSLPSSTLSKPSLSCTSSSLFFDYEFSPGFSTFPSSPFLSVGGLSLLLTSATSPPPPFDGDTGYGTSDRNMRRVGGGVPSVVPHPPSFLPSYTPFRPWGGCRVPCLPVPFVSLTSPAP